MSIKLPQLTLLDESINWLNTLGEKKLEETFMSTLGFTPSAERPLTQIHVMHTYVRSTGNARIIQLTNKQQQDV